MAYKLKIGPSQGLKLKGNAVFAIPLIGGDAIVTTKTGGLWRVDLDYSEVQTGTTVNDETAYVLTWDSATELFTRLNVTDLKAEFEGTFDWVYQPLDAVLTALADLTSAADKLPYFTGSATAALADFTAYGRSVVAVSNEAAFKTLVNLEIGVDVQAYDSDLTAFAAKTAPSGAVVGTTDTQTLTNKTLTSPVINGMTGSLASSVTGTTQPASDNSTKIATTAYVDAQVAVGVAGVASLNGQTGALAISVPPQGRLTLTSGVAVTTSDVAGATSVYFTPSSGNQVPIYNGTNTVPITFAELTLALDNDTGHTNYQASGKNYDLFVINDSGTVRLGTGPKWDDGAVAGSDTARGTGAASTELELINGIWTNKNTITIRFGSVSGNTVSVSANQATYVGTIRMTANGQTEDSLTKRFVYNAYNQAKRQFLRNDATASWAYSTASFRQANNSASNQVAYLAGLVGSALDITVMGIAVNSTSTYRVIYSGVGIDSTTVNSGTIKEFSRVNDTQIAGVPKMYYTGYAQLGYHYIAWLEKGAGADTQTWIGTEASDNYKSGIWGGIFQ